MSIRIGRIALAFLVLALAAGSVAIPASADHGGAVVAKSKSKCKKKAKRAAAAKKKKKCKRGGAGGAATSLPGQAAHPTVTPPVTPPTTPARQVSSVTLTAGTVLGGNSTSGQVKLDGAAPTGGQEVDLTSDFPARATVPASVVVISGQKTASFQVNTTFGTPVTATLTASIGTSNATAALKVVDRPSVASVKLQRQCFTPNTWPTNRVTLDIPAPDDTDVTLDSSDPLSLFLPLTTVTVPEGSTSALFTVEALPVASESVTVSATALSTPAQSDSASVSLTDPATHAAELTLDPDTVSAGNGTIATVTLDCEAPPAGTEVTLSSDDPSSVGVPGSVTVSPGQLTAEFPVTTESGIPDGDYAISATADGETVHATLHLSSFLPT